MKKITGLNDRLKALSPDMPADQLPTIRESLIVEIGKGTAKTADEARRCARIIEKLRGPETDMEFFDEDFAVIVAKVIENAHKFISYMQGQLLERIDPTKE